MDEEKIGSILNIRVNDIGLLKPRRALCNHEVWLGFFSSCRKPIDHIDDEGSENCITGYPVIIPGKTRNQ
jgi:hypothetical protein